MRVFAPDAFDLVLLDIRMAGMGGIAVLEEIQARAPGFTVVMMTAYGAIEVAVEALRKGAYDFITKPFDHDELIHHLGNALERGRLLQENSVLKKQVNATETFQGLVGASPVMQGIYDTIDMLSSPPVPDGRAFRRIDGSHLPAACSPGSPAKRPPPQAA